MRCRARLHTLLLAVCWALPAAAAPPSDCPPQADVPWQALVPGVWIWHPLAPAEVSVGNGGHVVPTTALVAGAEAWVIDPGPSLQHGLRVRQSLTCRFGATVRGIINTHAHAENVLANAAFADLQATGALTIAANAATRAAMHQRCPACLAGLTARAGADAMAGTFIVEPDTTLQEGQTLRLGPWSLTVLPTETGHTEGDLLLWSAEHQLLWAGGLVYDGRIPELAQGRLEHWLAALDRVQALGARHIVSVSVAQGQADGHTPAALLATRDYLHTLRQAVLQAMDAGQQVQDANGVPLPAFSHWVGYAERHGFNVQRAWRELEPVWMDQALPLPARPADPRDSGQHVGR